MSSLALTWEADGRKNMPPANPSKRAASASAEVMRDRLAHEREIARRILRGLQATRDALSRRMLSATAKERINIRALEAEVDRLIAEGYARLRGVSESAIEGAADLGRLYAEQPIIAAALPVRAPVIGLDAALVRATLDNTLSLLTEPMQEYARQIKVSLRRVALAGDGKFGEIQRLERIIEVDGFNSAQYRAERIIRTELGRTFNSASNDRLVQIANDFPLGLVRKCWRATNDNRTRLGHREASRTYSRGNGIPVANLFRIAVYRERKNQEPIFLGHATMRYPIDPDVEPERLGAQATILCRCNAFIDFDLSLYQSYINSRVRAILNPGLPSSLPVVGTNPIVTPSPAPRTIKPLAVPLPGSPPAGGTLKNAAKRTRRASKRKDTDG